MPTYKDYLKKIWYDPKNPIAFAGLKALRHFVIKDNKYRIGNVRLQKWLQNQPSYSVRRKVVRKVPTQKIKVPRVNYQWDGDLMDLSNIKEYNNNVTFVLVVIDVFNRYAYLRPLKSKKTTDVLVAFKSILNEKGVFPEIFRTDRGQEFMNKTFQKFCKDRNILHVGSTSNYKAAFAESFIGKFKNILYRYFHAKHTYRYIDNLQQFVDNYNNTVHSALHGLTPKQITPETQNSFIVRQLRAQLIKRKLKAQLIKKKKTCNSKDLNKKKRKKRLFKFNVRDKVRISYLKKPFLRGYQQKWSDEIFTIYKRFLKNYVPIYQLKDWDGDVIKGYLRNNELQKVEVEVDNLYQIDQILKRRTKNKVKEVFVSWLGWPKKFNSWISENSIKKFKNQKS